MTDAEFYDFIITPDAEWPTDINFTKQLQMISECPAIVELVRSISYNVLQRTPYWKTVSEHLLNRLPGSCCLCGESENGLVLHRKHAYGYGREWSPHDYGDFSVLCPQCYKKIQKYLPEIEQNVEEEIEKIIRNYK